MQSVSAELAAACAAAGQEPVAFLEVSWDGTGSLGAARGGAGWTDETAYVISQAGTLRLNAPSQELVAPGDVGQLALVLDNKTARYSWLRTDGPLYAYIGGAAGLTGIKVRFWQGYKVAGSPQYVRIFTGVITSWWENSAAGTVEVRVQDMGWQYAQQQRASSVISENQLGSAWIDALATMAGIAAGDRTLDQAIYRIPYVWLDDEALITEIWDTAAADGGRAYFDQLGKLIFENVLHWVQAPHDAVQWAFGEGDYEVLDPTYSTDDLATKIVVEYQSRAVGAEATLYTLREPRTAAPGETVTFEARFTWPAWEVIEPQASGDPIDFRVVSAGGFNMASDVALALSNTYAQKTTVSLTNNSTSFAATLAHLQIRGYPLLGGPIEQVETATTAPVTFDRDRNLRGNPYMQTWAQAYALSNFLAVKCARVRPTWRLRGVPGVPQLELGDRVSFVDRRTLGSGTTREGFLTGIRWQGSAETGYKQELEIMDAEGLYEYADWFYVGMTALGNHGRAWY